jgi:hypothetical protein
VKEDSEVEEIILFLEQISQWLGVHKGTFQGDGGNNLSSQEYPHMHDQFGMIPEETKKILLDFHGDIFQQLHVNQREKFTSNI